ncbi:MAG: SMC-Scp complex subunit ScpB [Myxococcales bacterium]|nr:SMC-Scp complex subunit ScpB [Myxococcales bacterium]
MEALILASPEPLSAARLADLVPRGKPGLMTELVAELNAEYAQQDRGFEIWEVAGGFQLRTRPDLASYVQQMHEQRPARLSRAALETLAIVAYRQPVTRAEIEHVRGVDAGPILRGLLDRKLVRIAGHRDVPGRPILYATSRRFLEVFGLNQLKDLPTLRDLEELLGEDGLKAGDERLSAIGGEEAGAVLADGEAGTTDPELPAPDPTADDPEPEVAAPPGGLH